MHDEIRKFSLEGELGEPNIVTTKERLLSFVEGQMRDYGYVPALDVDPQFTLEYSPDTQGFHFKLSVYGVEVDKEKSWDISGVMGGKPIPRYTPKHKSRQ